MNSITNLGSNANVSYTTLGLVAVAVVSSLTSIALAIFTKIKLNGANKKTDLNIGNINKDIISLINNTNSTLNNLQVSQNQSNQVSNKLKQELEITKNSLIIFFSLPHDQDSENIKKLIEAYCQQKPIPFIRFHNPTVEFHNVLVSKLSRDTDTQLLKLELQEPTTGKSKEFTLSFFAIRKEIGLTETKAF